MNMLPGAEGQRGQADGCSGDTCITCSDTAIQVTVVKLLPDAMALVDTGEGVEEVSVALVSADVGDAILVHASEALAVVRASTGADSDG